MKENKIQIVILAAGQGKRMGNPDLPKVLVPLKGKPLIKYLLEAVEKSKVCDKPVIVVGKMAEKVKKELGSNYIYVEQAEQLGTGDAVMTAHAAKGYFTFISNPEKLGTGHDVKATESTLRDSAKDIMVLYGDHPLVSAELVQNFAQTHLDSNSVLTMATVRPPDFEGWRSEFKSFGRILRDEAGKIIGMVEKKDANEQQLKIMELWPGYMCFKADWLWENLEKLGTNNAQGEYYLTDLVKIAVDQGHSIASLETTDKEGLGVNTPEQLKTIETLL